METIKAVLSFLNQINFCDKLINDEILEKKRSIKECLVDEFEEYSVDKLIYFVDIVYDMNIMIVSNELDDIHKRINDLRENIFYLMCFQNFVKTNENE